MGAAGLTSSSIEMAGRGGSGIELDVAKVPRREPNMTPYEIMLSESQERMVMVAKQGREGDVLRIFEKWDLDAAVIGRVTDTGHVVVRDGDQLVADIPVKPLTDGAPIYDRPKARPAWLDGLQSAALPGATGSHADALLKLLASPTIASKEWVYAQYDHQVRLGGVVLPGRGDAAVVRVERGTKGLALSADCNARHVYPRPVRRRAPRRRRVHAQRLVRRGRAARAHRLLELRQPRTARDHVQFAEATRGLADACRELNVPVVSGNVSLYNETDGKAVFPTPTVAVVGLLPDAAKAIGMMFRNAGDVIAVLGVTKVSSAAASGCTRCTARRRADRRASTQRRSWRCSRRCARWFARARSLRPTTAPRAASRSRLAECCMEGQGARVKLDPGTVPAHAYLFGEDASRVIVFARTGERDEISEACAKAGVPFAAIGDVGGRRARRRRPARSLTRRRLEGVARRLPARARQGVRLVYAHTVDGLFYRALAGQVTAPLKAELLGLGLDLDQKPKDLPQETWVKMLAAAVKHLYPRLPPDDGFFRLGETLMQGYSQTVMGRALFAMLKLLGPQRVLKRIAANLRSGNTYSEASAKELAPKKYEVWDERVQRQPGVPARRAVQRPARRGGAGAAGEGALFDGHAATFEVTWS